MRRRRVASAKSERIEAAAGHRDRGLFVAELKLVNFRNYARAELALDARPVVLVGDNGAGKTNLLEAVSLLGPGSGLRARPLGELGRTSGPGGFAVAARVISGLGDVEIGTGLARDQEGEGTGRSVRIAGKEGSPGALGDYVKLVWLIPAMDGLFTGPASERRRFLDRLMLAIDPKMRGPRARYDRAMRQRNRLFQLREGSPALFAGLEEQMAETGTAIAAARLDAVARLAKLIDDARALRGDGPFPWACLALEGTLEAGFGDAPGGGSGGRLPACAAGGARARPGRGACPCRTASERPNSHAWPSRHACGDLLVGRAESAPIGARSGPGRADQGAGRSRPRSLLLDEVAAHLDQARREALFGEILRLQPQAWMTGTDHELFAAIAANAQILTVNQGKIRA